MNAGKNVLTDRLAAIAAHVAPGERVADIGTDHGYIPIWLMSGGVTENVILTDINQGPLDKAAKNFRERLPGTEPDLRRGPGLSVLKPGEADDIVIAGMGGILISRILAEDPETAASASTLVLQPRNHSFTLRHFLRSMSGFVTADEEIVRERGLYCEIITVRRTDCLSDSERERAAAAAAAERRLGLEERIYDELPVMLALKGTYSDYLEHRCRTEIKVIETILAHGQSEHAGERRRRAEHRLAAFRKIQHLAD